VDLLFLGTSSGTPTKARNVSALALLEDTGKGWYLVDCGEATQHQVLRTPLSLHALRAIFITHVHGDHCYGLPGLLASAGMAGRTLASDAYLIPSRMPRRIVVGGDNDRPGLLAEACRAAHVLVHEATYTQSVAEADRAGFGHSSAAGVARFAEASGLPNLVLTHFSGRYQPDSRRGQSLEDIRSEAATHYRGKLFLAEDFLRLRLDKDGQLRRVE
jgi:ribonuclease BN (tRNA processing enzyme)